MRISHPLRGAMLCGVLLTIPGLADSPQRAMVQDGSDRDRDVDAILPFPGPTAASTVLSDGDVKPLRSRVRRPKL